MERRTAYATGAVAGAAVRATVRVLCVWWSTSGTRLSIRADAQEVRPAAAPAGQPAPTSGTAAAAWTEAGESGCEPEMLE
eukprot:7193946-Heterocapsa_arctica.AAC.1